MSNETLGPPEGSFTGEFYCTHNPKPGQKVEVIFPRPSFRIYPNTPGECQGRVTGKCNNSRCAELAVVPPDANGEVYMAGGGLYPMVIPAVTPDSTPARR